MRVYFHSRSRGVEFRGVGRQLVNLQPVPVGAKPVPHRLLLMVGRIVLDQDRTVATIPADQPLQKRQVGHRVEYGVLLIVKSRLPQLDSAEDLDTLALPGDRNLGRMSNAAPGGMQGRVLPEAGLIGKDQSAVFLLGFFFRLG